jgi:8-oxo-dGTP pyrophosphatase MutT (NUDIX family)/predicted ATPase
LKETLPLLERDLENHEAVVLLLKDEDGRYLCLFHNKFDFWTVPLGKAEDGQTPEAAACAEAFEELGIQVSRLAKRYQGTRVYCRNGNHIVTFFHIFEIVEYSGVPSNREPDKHAEMKFLSSSELRALPRTSDGTIMLLSLLDQIEAKLVGGCFSETFPAGSKIGLSGASGAGKTTLAKRLVDQHGATLHTETVRDWLTRNGNLRYASLSSKQFRELQLSLLDEYERSSANVFDRCPLDSLFYAGTVDGLLDENFKRRSLDILKSYSAIVFFPPYSDYLLDDGVRIADLKHQASVAANMLVRAYEYGVDGKILIYDHCRTMDENICELFAFLRRAGLR